MTTGHGAPAAARHHVHALAQQRVEFGEFEMRRAQHDAAARDLRDLDERPAPHEEAVDRILGEPRLQPENVRQVRLRIEVDTEGTPPALGDRRQQIERRGRLPDAALLVDYCDDTSHWRQDTSGAAR